MGEERKRGRMARNMKASLKRIRLLDKVKCSSNLENRSLTLEILQENNFLPPMKSFASILVNLRMLFFMGMES
jgi:hypothetical protein